MNKTIYTLALVVAGQIVMTGPSKAVMVYGIAEISGNLVIAATGSLNLPLPSATNGSCAPLNGGVGPGGLFTTIAAGTVICTGPESGLDGNIFDTSLTSGSNLFSGTANLSGASSSSGFYTVFAPFFQ